MRICLNLRTLSHFSNQKIIFFFGAPGVGKGTYSKMLAKDLSYNHISTGDQIRKILKSTTTPTHFSPTLIQQIKSTVNSGHLVSDQIILKIITQKVHDKQSKNGIILDGFPRTQTQLQIFDNHFKVNLVLNLLLRQDVLIDKLMGRRTCPVCNNNYNICDIQRDDYSMQPQLPKGDCEGCVTKLQVRDDDTREVIASRMREYAEKTEPMLGEFRRRGVLMEFQAKKGVKDYPEMKRRIMDNLREFGL